MTALSMPRLRSIGFMPAATAFRPSRTIAWASTVAVVVPSPATSEVLEATSFTICAPMFSNLSSSSISFATETPSLVTVGAPKLFSSTTLRPFGPSVTLTALARMLTPREHARAGVVAETYFFGCHLMSSLLKCSVCSGWRQSAFDDRHDVFLAHHEELLAVDLDLGAGVLAEQHLVADLDVERAHVAVLEDLALADGDDLAADRLLGRGVGDDDAAGGRTLLFRALDDDAVVQRTDLHGQELLEYLDVGLEYRRP